jgi:hypothetical protein
VKVELVWLAVVALVDQLEPAAGLGDEVVEAVS